MTKARQREHKRQQAELLQPGGDQYVYDAKQQNWFVNEWERRMSDLEKMRLAGKFGKKNEYSDWECKAIFEELERAGLDDDDSDLNAVEALFKKLNEADEAARAAQNRSS